MRRINKFAFLLFLIVLFPCVIHATNYSITWGGIVNTCNSYRYTITPLSCSMEVHYQNGSLATAIYNICTNYGYYVKGFKIDNAGNIYGVSSNDGLITLTVSPIPCSTGSCNYYFIFQVGSSSDSYITPITNIPVYSNCLAPSLIIQNSTIMADRYHFDFGVLNPWSLNWNCTFKLLGSNAGDYYQTIFSVNSSIDVLFTSFPKQTTLGRITCFYQSSSSQLTVFKDQMWIVDQGMYYNIYDTNRTIGKATPEPPSLTPYAKLKYLDFYILSQVDKTPFQGDIDLRVNSSIDLADYNCTGDSGWNSTYSGQPISPNGYYSYPVGITCDNPTTIPLTLTVWDTSTSQSLDTATFNVSWVIGNMVIDNINFVRVYNASEVQIYATISNEYTGTPIDDSSNLSCTYLLYRDKDSSNYTGAMTEIETGTPGGVITQTDMSVVIDNFTWTLGETGAITINCTANDYNNKTAYIGRIHLAMKGITTFKCSVNYPDYLLTYSISNYYTDPFTLTCVLKFDTSNDTDVIIGGVPLLWLENGAIGAKLQLQKNINAEGVGDWCSDFVDLPSSFVNSYGIISGMTSNSNIDEIHEKDAICNIIPIDKTKVSSDMVGFSIGSPFTSAYLYSSPFATLTFNIQHLQQPQVGGANLQIVNTKSSNQGTVELNDTLLCSVNVFDPNQMVDHVEFKFFSPENLLSLDTLINLFKTGQLQTLCSAGTGTMFNTTNSTSKMYYSILQANQNSCHFMSLPSKTGKMACLAEVYYYGAGDNTYKLSNTLAWQTPATMPQVCTGGYCTNATLSIISNNTCIQLFARPTEEQFNQCRNDVIGGFVNFVMNNLISFVVIIFLFILLEPYLVELFKFILNKVLPFIGEMIKEGEE